MATTKAVLILIGLCLLATHGDGAAVTITGVTISIAENTVTGGTVGTLTFGGSPTTAEITSEPNVGQFAIATTGVITLNTGFTLDYETASTVTIVVLASNADPASASATVTITVTDVVEEFDSTLMTVCLAGTSFSAGTTLFTKTASLSTVTAVYTLEAQTPNNGYLTIDGSTNAIKVAAGKTLTADIVPVYSVGLKLVSSSPAVTTSITTVFITFGCTSGGATLMLGGNTFLLALLVALLQ